MIQTMKLVEHKYLSINLKTDNQTNETKYQKKQKTKPKNGQVKSLNKIDCQVTKN